MAEIRLGLVGAGVIGQRHIGAIRDCDDIELCAIADPSAVAEKTAHEAGVPLFADTASMLAGAQCDGVIISTPTEHHLRPALSALKAGAHVLIEKPICATVDEAQQIVAGATKTGLHVLVAHQRRYYPQVEKARDLVQGGALGPLVAVSGQWTLRKHESYYDPDWRKKWQAGPVVTNLIHDMDAMRYICGEIESVMAEVGNPVLDLEKEDVAALTIRFVSGALGSFILSDQATSPWTWEMALGENISIPRTGENAMRFMGRDGSLEFPNLVLWNHAAPPFDWTQPLTREAFPLTAEDAYTVQMRHFAAVIRGEAPPRIDAVDAMRSLAATVAVMESARTGQRVSLA